MAALTISFINQKGGCGKSSTCFHLAGAFAQVGLRILLVDADPQGSLSQGFFGSTLVENLKSEPLFVAHSGRASSRTEPPQGKEVGAADNSAEMRIGGLSVALCDTQKVCQ